MAKFIVRSMSTTTIVAIAFFVVVSIVNIALSYYRIEISLPFLSSSVLDTIPVFESKIEDVGYIEPEQVHITHVFNSFKTRPGSNLATEHKLVQLSWQKAAIWAKKHGINVEFLNAVLEDDLKDAPDFARTYVLHDQIIDPENGHSLPTVGEIFKTGKYEGRGELLIYTNADIGVVEDFYVRVYSLARMDSRDPSFQADIIQKCAKLMKYCLEFNKADTALSNPTLCQEEVKNYYKLHGGHMPILSLALRDVARIYLKEKSEEYMKRQQRTISSKTLQRWYLNAGGTPNDLSTDVISIDQIIQFTPVPHKSDVQSAVTAFTITRQDLEFDIEAIDDISFAGIDQMLSHAIPHKHPGNDCFISPRHLVPEIVTKFRFPLGWRPWGFWITHAWEWEFGASHGLIWRRFESTPESRYTFHIGINGANTKNWVAIAQKHPMFVLNHPAEWNKLSNGKFVNLYNLPTHCKSKTLFRSPEYCNHTPEGIPFCKGKVRVACYQYQHSMIRDTFIYSIFCKQLLDRTMESNSDQFLIEPFCSYCEGLLLARQSPNARQFQENCRNDKRILSCNGTRCEFDTITN